MTEQKPISAEAQNLLRDEWKATQDFITATDARIAAAKPTVETCQAFLTCENPATTTLPNPVLGDVPACERCYTRLDPSKPATVAQAKKAAEFLKTFITPDELHVIVKNAARCEEKQFFRDKLVELETLITSMPTSYQNRSNDAIAYLHYFGKGFDGYVTEKDIDDDNEGQIQAYGLRGWGGRLSEGYMNLVELIENGIELDLYYTPKSIAAIKAAKE